MNLLILSKAAEAGEEGAKDALGFFDQLFYDIFIGLNFSQLWANVLTHIIMFCIILLFGFLIGLLCKRVFIPIIRKIVSRTPSKIDDLLLNDETLGKMAKTIPSIIIYLMLPVVFSDTPKLLDYLQRFGMIYIIAMVISLINAIVNSIFNIHKTKQSKEKGKKNNVPLRGISQMIKLVVAFLGGICIVGTAIGKDPMGLIAGLGAAATILTFIFKDSLVGLISGLQLSQNDMVRPGDWITVPGTAADGEVFDVTLTTVKIRNFDNTIITLPPTTLVSGSFQNWRGMQDSGVRRVSRSMYIDANTLHLCSRQELEKFKEAGYLDEIPEDRSLTNLEVLALYLEKYLRNYPYADKKSTILVRPLDATPSGLPLQLYFFCIKNEWITYEHILMRVITYAMAIVPQFGLALYQTPAGSDIKEITNTKEEK